MNFFFFFFFFYADFFFNELWPGADVVGRNGWSRDGDLRRNHTRSSQSLFCSVSDNGQFKMQQPSTVITTVKNPFSLLKINWLFNAVDDKIPISRHFHKYLTNIKGNAVNGGIALFGYTHTNFNGFNRMKNVRLDWLLSTLLVNSETFDDPPSNWDLKSIFESKVLQNGG